MTYTTPMVTELKYVRCRNSRLMPELSTVGTPDSCRNSRPSRHLKTSRWPLVVHTGYVRYEYHSELFKSVKARDVGTPDHCRNSRLISELLTNQSENNNFTIAGQILDTFGMNTGHVRYCQTSKKSVSSFVSQILKTHMGWLEHLWNIIYQHDASLLIVQHTY